MDSKNNYILVVPKEENDELKQLLINVCKNGLYHFPARNFYVDYFTKNPHEIMSPDKVDVFCNSCHKYSIVAAIHLDFIDICLKCVYEINNGNTILLCNDYNNDVQELEESSNKLMTEFTDNDYFSIIKYGKYHYTECGNFKCIRCENNVNAVINYEDRCLCLLCTNEYMYLLELLLTLKKCINRKLKKETIN